MPLPLRRRHLKVWRPHFGPTRFGAEHGYSPVGGHSFVVSLRWLMIRVIW